MWRSRVLEPSPLALVGGVLALISCFVAWDGYADSFDVPLRFLWDKDTTGSARLGVPLVAVAGTVTLFSISAVEPFVFLRRLGGVVLLGVTALFIVQLGRTIDWDNLSTDTIDAGPYLAGVGGLLVLIAPNGLWPFRRRRSDAARPPTAEAPPPADEGQPPPPADGPA
jgi:hypothetical protein